MLDEAIPIREEIQIRIQLLLCLLGNDTISSTKMANYLLYGEY